MGQPLFYGTGNYHNFPNRGNINVFSRVAKDVAEAEFAIRRIPRIITRSGAWI
ncbi:MAG: hypothetical protein ACE5KM_00080 [Planctomycetaceae bacterium]